ncbi:MAG: hypothetical protein M0Z58_02500 [Nitrospiraceae bacterium]|nr:hypothetical protein [Nitrospiraceae bacterium]
MKIERMDPAVKAILDRLKREAVQRFVDSLPHTKDRNRPDGCAVALLEYLDSIDGKFSQSNLELFKAQYLGRHYPKKIRLILGKKIKHRAKDLSALCADTERAELAYIKTNPEALADILWREIEFYKKASNRDSGIINRYYVPKIFKDEPHVKRGQKVLESASEGGKARTSKYDWIAIQGEAEAIWKRTPALSKSQVADNLKKKLTIVTPSISRIRQIIKKPL